MEYDKCTSYPSFSICNNCFTNIYKQFGKYTVTRVDDLDGYKFFFDENTWMMIRPSGTEPVLRVYAEAATKEKAFDILDDTIKVLLNK